MRDELKPPKIADAALRKLLEYQKETLEEVRSAVGSNTVVVVGMGWNPHVRRARRALEDANIPYTYLGYGNYLTGWRKRLAIKIWSGWPTFPQVYVSKLFIGGADELVEALADGSFKRHLDSSAPTPIPSEPRSESAAKPTDTKPTDTKPSDTKPSDTKPSDTGPAETKPAGAPPEGSSPEAKPAEAASPDAIAAAHTAPGAS